MTEDEIRLEIAKAALQSLIINSKGHGNSVENIKELAVLAWRYADEMIAARDV